MGTPAPSEHTEPPARAWWNSRFVVPGLMLLSTLPFWSVHTPPLIDFLAHIVRYHGQLAPFAIAAVWFTMSYPFQLGFVNYWLGCALAFHVFASWVQGAHQGAQKNGSVMR